MTYRHVPPWRTAAGRMDQSLAAALLLGVTVRVAHFLSERSLFIDEARLAVNIGIRNWQGLARPLELEQVATVPFLWAAKLWTSLAGMSELGLRSLPLLAGLLVLVLVARLHAIIVPHIAALATALVALSPALIRSANEFKQYSWDAAVAAAVLLCAASLLLTPDAQRRYAPSIGALLVAPVLSLPALLYCGPIGAIVAWNLRASHRSRPCAAIVVATAVGLCAGGLVATATYAETGGGEYMTAYWEGAMLRPDLPEFGGRFVHALSDLSWGGLAGGFPVLTADGLSKVLRWAVASLAWLLPFSGAVALVRARGWAITALLCAPTAAFGAAGLLGVYPAVTRLWIAAVPQWLLLSAIGIEAMARPVGKSAVRTAIWAVALIPGAMASLHPTFWPYLYEEVRDVAGPLLAAGPREAVYIYANAAPAWLYYSETWPDPDIDRVSWYLRHIQAGGVAFENAAHTYLETDQPLWRRTGDRIELLGIATGLFYRPYFGPSATMPAHGWAEHEAQRIMEIPVRRVHLLFSHIRGTETLLVEALEDRGAQLCSIVAVPGAARATVALPQGGARPSCPTASASG